MPKRFSFGVAKNIEPSIWSSTSGLSIVSSPILESLGQPAPGAESSVSAANWASEQVPRPEPTEGLTLIPSGRVTTAFLAWEEARASGFSSGAQVPSRVKS